MSEAKPVGFLGSLLMPRDPSESSPYSGSVFVLSFFLSFWITSLGCWTVFVFSGVTRMATQL